MSEDSVSRNSIWGRLGGPYPPSRIARASLCVAAVVAFALGVIFPAFAHPVRTQAPQYHYRVSCERCWQWIRRWPPLPSVSQPPTPRSVDAVRLKPEWSSTAWPSTAAGCARPPRRA